MLVEAPYSHEVFAVKVSRIPKMVGHDDTFKWLTGREKRSLGQVSVGCNRGRLYDRH